jgi:hypothetical protein
VPTTPNPARKQAGAKDHARSVTEYNHPVVAHGGLSQPDLLDGDQPVRNTNMYNLEAVVQKIDSDRAAVPAAAPHSCTEQVS